MNRNSVEFCSQSVRPCNCRIQLLVVVIVCKQKQNQKSDDDAVHKLCSQSSESDQVQTVKLTLYKYNSWWHVLCEIKLDY